MSSDLEVWLSDAGQFQEFTSVLLRPLTWRLPIRIKFELHTRHGGLILFFQPISEKVDGVVYMSYCLLRVLLLILRSLMTAHPDISSVDTIRLNGRLGSLRKLEIDGLGVFAGVPHDIWIHPLQAIISSF